MMRSVSLGVLTTLIAATIGCSGGTSPAEDLVVDASTPVDAAGDTAVAPDLGFDIGFTLDTHVADSTLETGTSRTTS